MLTVDEDWGQASIFINLARRRYLKTVERGLAPYGRRSLYSLILKADYYEVVVSDI